MQIKQRRYHFMLIGMIKIQETVIYCFQEHMEQMELAYIAGGNVKQHNHCRKTVWQFLIGYSIHFSPIQQFHFPLFIQGNENICPEEDLWKNVHSGFIHHSYLNMEYYLHTCQYKNKLQCTQTGN